MKKCMILLLLIFSTVFVRAMQKGWSSFTRCFVIKELQGVEVLRASKDHFEKKLKKGFGCACNEERHEGSVNRNCSLLSIDCDPCTFLRYCYYYQKIHGNGTLLTFEHLFKIYSNEDKDDIDFFLLIKEKNDRVSDRIKKCQKARIDDYSAIGALMIAGDMSFKKKHRRIQKLMQYGFEPTLKDKQLAELILYDAIVANSHKEAFMYLLYDDLLVHILLKDIRKQIARYLIEMFKKDYWLLP